MSKELEHSSVPGWLKRALWSQVLIIVFAVLAYGFVWRRIVTSVRSLQAQKQQLTSEIDSLNAKLGTVNSQNNNLSKDVTRLTAGIHELPGTGTKVQELKDQSVLAWTRYVPKEAWCYQERDKEGNRYSVYCHWSEDRCNRAKQGSRRATSCDLVPNLDSANWSPMPKGLYDSWYQLDREKPLPPPFPQFKTEAANVILP